MTSYKSFKRSLLRSGSALGSFVFVSAGMGGAIFAAPAFAQDSAPAEEAQGAIVVTGSRIARPELEAPTPIAVVSSDMIERDGSTNIQDVLQKLPQVGIGTSRTNSNFSTTGNGISTVNLRNLGSSRTLVLVNGRRFVAGVAGTSIVDINNIPTDFLERVETVTGGASAIYGSDAIAGVVNFVLKDHFEGVKLRGQYGVTSRGDNPRYSASITAGTHFGPDSRGNVMLNFTYDKDTGLYSRDRQISSQDCSALGCGPQSYSSYAAQGRFQLLNASGAATGNAGGYKSNLFTFNPDNSLVTGFPTGYGFNRNSLRRISVPLERYLATGIFNYELTDHIKAFTEITYSKVKASSAIEPYALDSANDLGVGYSIDNPFIPAAIAAQIAARNSDANPSNDVASIGFRRRQNDVFNRSNRNNRDTWRVATGLKGDLGSKFNWELSYVFGQLKDHTETEDLDITRYRDALDAVRDINGNIVCRSASARANGCVPINLFGYNTASPAAAAYVRAVVPRTDDIKNTEHVISANLTGSPFSLPGGDVQVSMGAEYRKEKSIDNWDALTNAGQNSGNQTPDTIGSFDVSEVYGEVQVPLISDKPLVSDLRASGAVRYSHYSTTGDVFSWNAGGEYSPFKGLRFRGNYAVANRAPNISELFSAASETFPAVQDPCNGVTAASGGSYGAACRAIPAIANAIAANGAFQYTLADIQRINGFDGGNPHLSEEKGKTLTLGAVVAPVQIPGLSLTVDYFDIKVSGAIGNVPRSTSIQQCLLTGLPQFCNNVIRDPNTGLIQTVNATLVNIAKTRTKGLDVGLNYGRNVDWLGDDRVDFNLNYTHTFKYDTQSDPSAPINSGVGNLEYGEVFGDKATGRLTYAKGPWSISWQTTYLSHMHDTPPSEFDPTGLDPVIASHNNIAARWYHDVQLRADVGEKKQYSVYFGIDNIFDRKPPVLEDTVFYGTITGTTTAADVYDPYGRRFYVGAQVKF